MIAFSPHAWGWTAVPHTHFHKPAVFPTRVGMDRRLNWMLRSSLCFPHTRGDGPSSRSPCATVMSFSPHAWGWTALRRRDLHTRSVFPTRVGMDRSSRIPNLLLLSFPHTRGDGPMQSQISQQKIEFSPHAWGWTVCSLRAWRLHRVFPTRVGMDRR